MSSKVSSRLSALAVASALGSSVVFVAPPAALAQPGISVSVAHVVSSIDQPSLGREQRQTIAGSVEAEQVANEGRLRLFYEIAEGSVAAEGHWRYSAGRFRLFYHFDGGTFATDGDWRYSEHSAGATVRLPFGSGERPRHAVCLTADGIFRNNGSSWSAVDYLGLSLIASVEARLRDTATCRLGYRLDRRVFPGLPELNQLQHDGFVSVVVDLLSRTTLISEAHVGARAYAATIDTNWAAINAGRTRVPRGVDCGAGQALRGRWMGSAGPATATANNAGMVALIGRVAQSLGDRTDVWAQCSQRTTFGRVPPVVVTTPAEFFEDGVYDDPFASGSRVVTAAIRHAFASGVSVDADVARMIKDYTAALAIDLDGAALAGEPLRADRIWCASAGVSIPILPSRTGSPALSLDASYAFTRHRSNDAFYNYTSHGVASGFSISY